MGATASTHASGRYASKNTTLSGKTASFAASTSQISHHSHPVGNYNTWGDQEITRTPRKAHKWGKPSSWRTGGTTSTHTGGCTASKSTTATASLATSGKVHYSDWGKAQKQGKASSWWTGAARITTSITEGITAGTPLNMGVIASLLTGNPDPTASLATEITTNITEEIAPGSPFNTGATAAPLTSYSNPTASLAAGITTNITEELLPAYLSTQEQEHSTLPVIPILHHLLLP